MSEQTTSDGINWAQLADLVGDMADEEQKGMLVEMWSDVKTALPAEWAKLDGVGQPEVLRRDLHRVRGYVSTWGMDAVAAGLLSIERSPDPLGAWRERGAALIAMQRDCVLLVEQRYPGLAAMA